MANVMRSNELKFTVILSYFQIVIQAIISLFYTPIMIRILGQNQYGLYSTAISTIGILSILRLGFNNSYIRYYSIFKKEKDYSAIWRLNGTFIMIFSFIGCMSFFSGLFIIKNLDFIFSKGLNIEEYNLAKKIMLILTVNLSISFPMSVFNNIIFANEKFIFLKIIEIVKTVLSPLVMIILLFLGYRVISLAISTLLFSIVSDSINIFFVVKKLKNKFIFKKQNLDIFGGLFRYTFFIAIESIVDQINWNVDKVIIARYRGTQMVAIYSVGYALYAYFQNFSISISNVFLTTVHKIINEETNSKKVRSKLTELFIKVGRIQFFVLMFILGGIIFFGRYFIINIWVGESYIDSYYIVIILTIAAFIPLVQNLGIEIQRAQFRHQFRSVIYFIMALINLCVSILLCKKYGAVGSALGTAISLIFANGLIMNIYYHKKCNIDILMFWKNIFRLLVISTIPFSIYGIINLFIKNTNLEIYIIKIIMYIVIYAIFIFLFGMNNFEKKLVIQMIKNLTENFKFLKVFRR